MRRPWFSIRMLPGLILLFAAAAVGSGSQETSPASDSAASPAGTGAGDGSTVAVDNGGKSPDVAAGFAFPTLFPAFLKNHLVGRFTAGQSWDQGISNGSQSNTNETYSELGASFTYSLERRRSEYVFDYGGSARRYGRSRSLDTLAHEAGLSQQIAIGPRTTWRFAHHLTFTPDFSGGTLSQNLVNETSVSGPLPGSDAALGDATAAF